MADKAQTSFEKLYQINVNDKTEEKNGLTYLSWAWAWAEFKKVYPDATYNIIHAWDNKPFFYDENLGYMVETEVVADGLAYTMWLPVMDGNNRAMKSHPYTIKTKYKEFTVQAATMFDINKTLMRCLVKNMAMFGLGLYIYAGEDLPEEEQHFEPPKKTKAKKGEEPSSEDIKKMLNKSQVELAADLKKLLMETDSDVKVFLDWASKRYKRNIRNVDEMIPTELEDAIIVVTKKKGDK